MGSATSPERSLRIAIIGAGPGGLCMGKRLLDLGFEDFVLLEKSDGVDVEPEPIARYEDEGQEAIAGVAVSKDGCRGYDPPPGGRIVTQWPFSMVELRERSATVRPAAFSAAPH